MSVHASPLAVLGGIDGGAQNVHVAGLSADLAALGADVVVHTRRDNPALPRRVPLTRGVMLDHVDAGPAAPLSKDALLPYMDAFADDLERHWRLQRPDVVHAHFWMSGLAATRAAERLGVPVALTYHALGAEERHHQGAADTSPATRLASEAWLARNVDRVIATTAAEARVLVRLGALAERVTVIPCGVDLDAFTPRGRVWPRRSGMARVVCVSRLVPRKGLADTVAAIAGLPNVELLIAGGPPADELRADEHARELQALARELGVEDRVRLLGAVDHHRIPALLRSASVVCCTPWYEPFGLVAVEAMASGVPVVATAVGGLAETVIDGLTGIHVLPHRPKSIRSAVKALTSRSARLRAMRRAAVRRAAEYGCAKIAARTYRVALELSRDGRRRSTVSALQPVPPVARTADVRPARALEGGGA
ncbi:MAG: glycosyltransferase [Planctomycetota bacterium]